MKHYRGGIAYTIPYISPFMCLGWARELISSWLICKFDGFLSLWPVAPLPLPAYVFLLLCPRLPHPCLKRGLLCEFCVCFVVLRCICICGSACSFLLWPHFYLLCLYFSLTLSLSLSRSLRLGIYLYSFPVFDAALSAHL